jgi:serine/threonine protein kinase
MSSSAIQLFKDALQGVQFLHSNGWIHGDLKPANIGVNYHRAVLLDIGGAIQLSPGEKVPSTPGYGGTIYYLAPEREMQDYDNLIDVWSMGVIGYELRYGHHPWKMTHNPWRPGRRYEFLRPLFNNKYHQSMQYMNSDEDPEALKCEYITTIYIIRNANAMISC